MSYRFSEDDLEQVALEWFSEFGYEVKDVTDSNGTSISTEREGDKDVVLNGRLEAVMHKINPNVPSKVIQQAIHELTVEKSPSLLENNRNFHELLINGIEVEYYNDNGEEIIYLSHKFPTNLIKTFSHYQDIETYKLEKRETFEILKH